MDRSAYVKWKKVKWKKRMVWIFIVTCLIIPLSCAQEDGDDHHNEDVSIFYSPHPDDETLSMGAAILDRVDQQETVHVVLLTQGGASSAFDDVNDRLEAHGMEPITIEAFKQGRVDEFYAAVRALGMDDEQIHVLDYPDGQLHIEAVRTTMEQFEDEYPGAHHHAFSYADPHPDHAVTGEALHMLYEQNIVSQASFYYPKYVDLDMGSKVVAPEPFAYRLRDALAAYGVWEPEEGRYAIGHASIGHAFAQAEDAMFDWVHGPGEG